MEYYLVSLRGSNSFNEAVNSRLKDGWSLFGSPYSSGDGINCQAMIRFPDGAPLDIV